MERALLALRPLEHRRAQGKRPERRSRHLDLVPGFVGHREGHRLARQRVAVPVRKLEVVISPGQARSVVDARPRRLPDAVVRPPVPALEVVHVVDLDLAHADGGGVDERRHVSGPVPSMAVPPLVAPPWRVERSVEWRKAGRGAALGEGGDAAVLQQPIVDAQFVDVAAAHEVVRALDLVRADDARVRAELIEGGIEPERAVTGARKLTVHVEAHAARLVPRQGQVRPRRRPRKRGQRVRHAAAREARIGDERIEPGLAVVVDAQPHHVPAGVVGVTDAEDWKRRRADRLARPPEERQRAPLRVNVASRPVREQLGVAALQAGPRCAVGDDGHLAREIRFRCAASRVVGRQPVRRREMEQQARLRAGGRGGCRCARQQPARAEYQHTTSP